MKIDDTYEPIEFFRDFFMTDDEESISAVASHCHIVKKKKGDILYGPGATEGSTIVLLDGVLRTYILSPDGTENTLTFWFKPGTFINVTKEMINIPAYWCVAATDCTLIEMVGTTVYDLAEEYPLLWKEIMFGTLPFAVRIMDKARAGYTLPAKERYLWFLENYGPVESKVSQLEIASFLGIAPQSLSRIRAELEQEGVTPPPEKLTNDKTPVA